MRSTHNHVRLYVEVYINLVTWGHVQHANVTGLLRFNTLTSMQHANTTISMKFSHYKTLGMYRTRLHFSNAVPFSSKIQSKDDGNY